MLLMDSSTSTSKDIKQAQADLDACVLKYSWLFCVGAHSLAIDYYQSFYQLYNLLMKWREGVSLCYGVEREINSQMSCTGGVALSVPISIRIKASMISQQKLLLLIVCRGEARLCWKRY